MMRNALIGAKLHETMKKLKMYTTLNTVKKFFNLNNRYLA
jgi:hypothetical protein